MDKVCVIIQMDEIATSKNVFCTQNIVQLDQAGQEYSKYKINHPNISLALSQYPGASLMLYFY